MVVAKTSGKLPKVGNPHRPIIWPAAAAKDEAGDRSRRTSNGGRTPSIYFNHVETDVKSHIIFTS
jgi:predicted RNA polymerase sigma factor